MEHCKLLSLAHCNCFVVAVYKSLALTYPLSYEDMEAAVEQCEEALIEINITNYLQTVCKHLSETKNSNSDSAKSLSCNDVKPLHNLIKDKFEGIMTVAFRPVPAHPEFYYCSPSWNSDRMVCNLKFSNLLHGQEYKFDYKLKKLYCTGYSRFSQIRQRRGTRRLQFSSRRG